MTKTISIIIPTYNRLFALAELIECLYQQSYQNFEVIIVNDAGQSVEIIKNLYPELYITIINLAKNSQHVIARNIGLDIAKTEFILLCDDDDLLHPTHLENLVNAIDNYDLLFTDAEIFNYKISKNTRIPIDIRLFAYKYDPQAIRIFSTFIPSGCLYRRSIHKKIGLFDSELHNYWDWDFILRVQAEFRVNKLPIASVYYAFSNENNMSANHQDMTDYLTKLCQKHNLGKLPTKNFFLLLEEPQIKQLASKSKRLWNQQPIISRLAKQNL